MSEVLTTWFIVLRYIVFIIIRGESESERLKSLHRSLAATRSDLKASGLDNIEGVDFAMGELDKKIADLEFVLEHLHLCGLISKGVKVVRVLADIISFVRTFC